MRLISMRLQNFRLHENSYISFAPGLTGIVGANGSGKSTILEGLAFGFYGTVAARGVKDGIKWMRASSRASVRVEIEFALAGHRYRVVRGLSMAELYLNDAATPIANSLSGVSDQMQRILGMTKDEFFMTYFTAQKELNALSTLGPTERAKFLSRALGFDRIAAAQELARDRKRALVGETNGLRLAMPEIAAVERAIADAEDRVAVASARVTMAYDTREVSGARFRLAEPTWKQSLVKRDRDQALASERRVVEANLDAVNVSRTSFETQLVAVGRAQLEHDTLAPFVADLPALRARLAELDALATADMARQQAIGTVSQLREQMSRIRAQIETLNVMLTTEPQLMDAVNAAMLTSNALAAEHQAAREAWTSQTAQAKAERERLLVVHGTLKAKRDELLKKGADGNCAACGKPLGASWQDALAKIDEDLDELLTAGSRAKVTLDSLAEMPPAVAVLAQRSADATRAIAATDQALQAERARVREDKRLRDELAVLEPRLATASASLSAVAQTYDAQLHADTRAHVAALGQKETRMAVLQATTGRGEQLRSEVAAANTRHAALIAQQMSLDTERATNGHAEAAHLTIVREYEESNVAAKNADVDAMVAEGESSRAKQALEFAIKQREDTAVARAKLADLEVDRLRHEELERQFTALRTELNAKLRPELAEIASGLLDVLTDGRYNEAQFDDDYVLRLVEDGMVKGVISGGEEDLCNLVLRLAISQMIAARAGHAFSLLILDEVFGSLDDTRRENVMALLRGLNDRFEQVIVISHIGQIRDGLDSVIQVRFDAELGSSVVTDGEGRSMVPAADLELQVAA